MGRTFKDSKKYYKGDSKPRANPKDRNKKNRQWQRDNQDANTDWRKFEDR